MKLNFKQMEVIAGISDKNTYLQDVRESFANIVYRMGNGIACLELARKIYNSDGDEEYTDNEVKIIRQMSHTCTPQFIESINRMLNKEEEK